MRLRNITPWLGVVVVTIVVGAFVVGLPAAEGKGGLCHGTYLMDQGATGEGLVTMTSDGTVQVTDSAQGEAGYSHRQGAWQKVSKQQVTATWMAFSFGPPAGYGRVDAAITFDVDCGGLTGTLDAWS